MTSKYLDGQPQLLKKWSDLNPLHRLGRPDEMRGVVTWLASDASTYCTGSEYVFPFHLSSTGADRSVGVVVSSFAVVTIRGKSHSYRDTKYTNFDHDHDLQLRLLPPIHHLLSLLWVLGFDAHAMTIDPASHYQYETCMYM